MIATTEFGKLANGKIVEQFSLTNGHGVCVDILNLGGIIRRWLVPNSSGKTLDIVLGYDSVEQYLNDDSYLGATVGRYANRIHKGQFSLDNQAYQVGVNLGEHSLHGGFDGFNRRLWKTSVLSKTTHPSIALELISPDGDQGFPGQLNAKVIYTLTEQNTLQIEYFAHCDQTTVYNPTNHSYFNLSGHNSGSVKHQHIQLEASTYTPTNEQAIPTGELLTVEDSPFDFRQLQSIESALQSPHLHIKYGNGLDHNWCLDNYQPHSQTARYAGQTTDKHSGMTLKVYTSMPGIQVFTANHFANKQGKDRASYEANQGICFETQFYPDSPNQPNFPSPMLKAEEEFYSITQYQLTIE